MTLQLREARLDDAAECGRICYDAFYAISTAHNFPPDFPDPEVAIGLLSMLIAHPGHHFVVAERDGKIVGSNVLDERGPIAGVGPITVDPAGQNAGVGRQLMMHVIERAMARGLPGVRLVQAAFHNRSLALYASIGFEPREPLSCVQGPALGVSIPGFAVRAATAEDLDGCNTLCIDVHGHSRSGEVRDALAGGSVRVVEHGGTIVGYTTGIGFIGHTVAEHDQALMALIADAREFFGPGFLLPTRNARVLRWCLEQGLRITQPMTLMSLGLYNEPRGAYLPSIAY